MTEKFLMNVDDKMSYEEGLCSIIVPVHNRHEYVAAALESAWKQTCRPLELIIVDDGSTDSSPQVVSEWISNHQNDPTFQIIFHCQNNQGACAARNHGLMLSKGEFIQWLDDDDVMYPLKIEKQVKYLKGHPEIDIVACNLDYLDADLRYITQSSFREPFDNELTHHYIIRQDIVGYAPVYRKKVLLNVGGWSVGIPCGQDTDLHVRLSIEGAKFAIINDVLGGIRCHNKGRMTGTVLFSRGKEALWYDADFFKRIMNYAESFGKADVLFQNLVALRLLESSRIYFKLFMPKRAQICLRQAHKFSPESCKWIYRFYKSPLGMIIACPIEFIRWNTSRFKRLLNRLAKHIVHEYCNYLYR